MKRTELRNLKNGQRVELCTSQGEQNGVVGVIESRNQRYAVIRKESDGGTYTCFLTTEAIVL